MTILNICQSLYYTVWKRMKINILKNSVKKSEKMYKPHSGYYGRCENKQKTVHLADTVWAKFSNVFVSISMFHILACKIGLAMCGRGR